MAITVTKGTANTTAAGTFNVTIPAHAAGDVLVLMVGKISGSSASPEVTTSGWTEVIDDPDATATTHTLVAWKVGDGSETTVTISNMSAGPVIGKVYSCAAADGSTPVVGSVAAGGTGTSRLLDLTETCAAGQAAFGLVTLASTSAGMAIDSSYTLDHSSTSYGMASKVLTSSDETGTFSWTTSRSAKSAFIVIKENTTVTGTAALTNQATTMAASGSSTTGTAAPSSSRQTMAASGTHGIGGTAAITPAAHVVAAAGDVIGEVTGTAAVAHGAHAMEASGLISIAGSAALTNQATTMAAAGTITTVGTAAVTHGAHVASGAGTHGIAGTAAITHGAHVMSASSSADLAGFGAVTNARHGTDASGTVLAPVTTFVLTGRSGGWARPDLRVKRRRGYVIPNNAVPVTGTAALVNGAHVVAGAGAPTVVGTGSPDVSRHVVATVAFTDVTGTAALTNQATTMAASGTQQFTGFAAISNVGHTMASAGVVGVTGTAAPQVAAHTVAGIGGTSNTGTAEIAPTRHTMAAAGGRGATGTAAPASTRHSVTASGTVGTTAASWDAYSRTGPIDHTLGIHASTAVLASIRNRTGKPWKRVITAPGGAVLQTSYDWTSELQRLNFETGADGVRLTVGCNWFWDTTGDAVLGNNEDPTPSTVRMQEIGAGVHDSRLDSMGQRLAAFTDDQLRRTVIRGPHEVGAAFARWQQHESLSDADNLVRAGHYAAAWRRWKTRVDLQLGARASMLTWEFNIAGFSVNVTGTNLAKQYIDAAWPGNSFVDLITFDFYANYSNDDTDMTRVCDYINSFNATHGNKPIGIWETSCQQAWGSELADRQASHQIPFYETLSTYVQDWHSTVGWAGMHIFDKNKGGVPTTPDGVPTGTGEKKAMMMFQVTTQALGSLRVGWQARVGTRPAWACNYPDVAERLCELF